MIERLFENLGYIKKGKQHLPQANVMPSLPSVAELRLVSKDRPNTFINGALYVIDLIERGGNGA